jgi:hypothetical protein
MMESSLSSMHKKIIVLELTSLGGCPLEETSEWELILPLDLCKVLSYLKFFLAESDRIIFKTTMATPSSSKLEKKRPFLPSKVPKNTMF